jgi:glutamate racemase
MTCMLFQQGLEPITFQGLQLGVFDSGLGGLSMMAPLHRSLPGAAFHYVADSAHAPYGERQDSFILSRCRLITQDLLAMGADMIVVACNTATAVAIRDLRRMWPNVPFIGVEPGVKPAIASSASGRIGVLATPMTLASAKFRELVADHAAGAVLTLQPCPGLAAEIERGALDSPRLRALVRQFTKPLLDADVDTVVLGCTHYPLILPLFEWALPGVRIVDTSGAVARHARRLAQVWIQNRPVVDTPLTNQGMQLPTLRLWSTGEPTQLQVVAQQWLSIPDLQSQRWQAS